MYSEEYFKGDYFQISKEFKVGWMLDCVIEAPILHS